MSAPLLKNFKMPPCEVIAGNSPVILAGPHNGYAIPPSLHDENDRPLGLHTSCFDPLSPFKRHEACDWGMIELFGALQDIQKETHQQYHYISGNYSRLICDLSRAAEDSMTPHSSENESPIPLNVDLTEDAIKQRTETFYDPFHDTLKETIQNVRTQFGRVIFIDLHSFTPIWNGQPRDVKIGTLSYRENAIEKHFLSFLPMACAAFQFNFGRDEPYNLKELPPDRNKITQQIRSYGADYFGLEFRNDILSTSKGVANVARIVHDALQGFLELEL